MDTYKVKVLPAGHMISFRGKLARTPVVFHGVLRSELQLFEAQARRSMLIIDISKESEEQKETIIEPLEILKEDEDIEIEELDEKKPGTILEKLLDKSE